VQARRVDRHVPQVAANETVAVSVAVRLGDLDTRDVKVECIFGRQSEELGFVIHHTAQLRPVGLNEEGESVYALEIRPPLSGLQYYKLRVYPFHPLMHHPFESGRMLWI
jgi:starch phosphorylase